MQPTKESMRRLAASLCDQFETIYRRESRRPLPALDLPRVPEDGRGYDALPELWSLVVAQSANLAAPLTMAHMDTAPHPAAALSDAVVSALNNNLLFRELSPLASRIEEVLVAHFVDALGLDAEWTGTFVSGGSLANLTALFGACGGFADRQGRDALRFYVSESAHVSVAKAAAVLGIAPAQMVPVAHWADERARAQ